MRGDSTAAAAGGATTTLRKISRILTEIKKILICITKSAALKVAYECFTTLMNYPKAASKNAFIIKKYSNKT